MINKIGFAALVASAAMFVSAQAQAATQTVILTPTATGAVGGFFSLPLTSPSFSDEFDFAVPGSGVVTAGGINVQLQSADITFTSVFLNGVMGTVVNNPAGDGSISSFNFGSVNTVPSATQVLIVNGTTTGGAGYGGTITFTAAVPEASSWAMLLVGLGLVGGVLRQRAKVSRVTFA